eukprot:7631294-Pyramimonas_sp.AAC.2
MLVYVSSWSATYNGGNGSRSSTTDRHRCRGRAFGLAAGRFNTAGGAGVSDDAFGLGAMPVRADTA